MIIGKFTIEKVPAKDGFKTEYRVWQTVVAEDVFTGEKSLSKEFKGVWNNPKNLFRALAELAI